MAEIFFTSDLHLEHTFVAKTRGFNDVGLHTEYIMDQFNDTVGPKDKTFILGDFGFMQNSQVHNYVKKLNGKKYLILGNHDKMGVNHTGSHGFEWIKHYHEEMVEGIGRFCLFHYPLMEWHWMDRPHVYHLYGHVHNHNPANIPAEQRPYKSMDVGVDTRPYYTPYHIDEVVELLKDRPQFMYNERF